MAGRLLNFQEPGNCSFRARELKTKEKFTWQIDKSETITTRTAMHQMSWAATELKAMAA